MTQKKYWFLFSITILISILNIFLYLWELPIQDWDEARHGINAYEMLKNKNYFVNYYLGEPDFWNLKPPLGTWLISISFSIFGVNPFGLRFFSSFFGLLTIITTMLYTKTKYNETISILSGIILSTCISFIHFHGARTGDFDAIFTFFVLLSVIVLDNKNKMYFYLSFLIFSLSFLLKSFASVMIGLVIILSFLLHKTYKQLKLYDYIISLLVGTLPLLIWFIGRFSFDGLTFFQKMVSYDLIERGTKTIEGHQNSPLFYLEPIFLKFLPWSILLLLIIPFLFRINTFNKNKLKIEIIEILKDKTILIYLTSVLIPALLVSTKTEWYIMPIFPVLSIIISWFVYKIISEQHKGFLNTIKKISIPMIVIFFIVAETITLMMSINTYLRGFQFRSSNIDELISELNIQKLLVSENIPKNSIVGIIGRDIFPSYIFISKAMKEYELVKSFSLNDEVKMYITDSTELKDYKIIDKKGKWYLILKNPSQNQK